MQPIKQLNHIISGSADEEHCLFTLNDLRGAIPGHTYGAFKALISRAVQSGVLERVCRGLYLYPKVPYDAGLLLFHAAARLRAHWARIGKCAEENPDLTYDLIKGILIGVEELEQGEMSEYTFG